MIYILYVPQYNIVVIQVHTKSINFVWQNFYRVSTENSMYFDGDAVAMLILISIVNFYTQTTTTGEYKEPFFPSISYGRTPIG